MTLYELMSHFIFIPHKLTVLLDDTVILDTGNIDDINTFYDIYHKFIVKEWTFHNWERSMRVVLLDPDAITLLDAIEYADTK